MAAWSPDGTRVATASRDKGYQVIDEVFESSFAPLTGRQREELYSLISRVLTEGDPPQRVGL